MNYLTNFVSNHEAFFDSFEQNIHGVDSKLRKKAKLEAYKFRRDLVKEFISEHQLPLGELAEAFEGSEISEKQKDRLAKALYLVLDDKQDPISAEQKTVIGNFLHSNQQAKKSIEGIKGQRLESDLLNLSSRVVTSHGLNDACTKLGELNDLTDRQSIYFGFDDAFFVKKDASTINGKFEKPQESLESKLESNNENEQQIEDNIIKSAKIDKSEIIDHINEHAAKIGLSHVDEEIVWLSNQIGDDITQGDFLSLIEKRQKQLELDKENRKQEVESSSKLDLGQLKSKLSVIAATFNDDGIKEIIEKAGIDIPPIDEDSENVDMVIITENNVIEPSESQFGVIRDAEKLSEIVLEKHRDYASEAQRVMIENGFIFEKHVNRFEKFIKPTAKYDDDALIKTMLEEPEWSKADAEREESRFKRDEKRRNAKVADSYDSKGKGLADRLKGTFESAKDWAQDRADDRHDKRNRDKLTSPEAKKRFEARVIAREIIRSDKSVVKDKSGNEIVKLSSGRSMLDVISGRTGNYARASFTKKGFLNPEVHKISALKLKEAGVKKPLITLPTHSSVSESDKKEFLKSTYKSLREAGYEPEDIAYSTGMMFDKALRQDLDNIRKEVDLEIAQKEARNDIKFGAMMDSEAPESELKPDSATPTPEGEEAAPSDSSLLATGDKLDQTLATGHTLKPSGTSGGEESSSQSEANPMETNDDLGDSNTVNQEVVVNAEGSEVDVQSDNEEVLQDELDEDEINREEQRLLEEKLKAQDDAMVADVNLADSSPVVGRVGNIVQEALGKNVAENIDQIDGAFSADANSIRGAAELRGQIDHTQKQSNVVDHAKHQKKATNKNKL